MTTYRVTIIVDEHRDGSWKNSVSVANYSWPVKTKEELWEKMHEMIADIADDLKVDKSYQC